jgi:hypothetical protein
MHNGVANPSSFKLSGPTMKGDGKGSVNMVNKSLDYSIAVQIEKPMRNQILNKIIFPYSTHGKFDKLEGSVDWASIQKQLAEYFINQVTNQAKDLAKAQVSKQINTLKSNVGSQIQQQTGAKKIINNLFR